MAESLTGRGDTAVFSHFVAINAVLTHIEGEERVVGMQPDHASIHVLDTDGRLVSLISKGREAATSVL